MSRRGWILALLATGLATATLLAEGFRLPTANRALFEADGGGERFFVGTAGRTWTSGQFGCVRTEGRQLHEGLDIRAIQRDRRGEPLDPVRASVDGTVAYINRKPSLSNYGNYVVLRHVVDQVEIHTLYAHLASVDGALKPGGTIRAGELVGVMGRTSNTGQRISLDRAHVHFEICFRTGSRYAAWHAKHRKGMRNDHGEFNGQNFLGIDPAPALVASERYGNRFSLAAYLAAQPEMIRVFVRNPRLQWATRFAGLVQRNPTAEREGVAGYELFLAFNGAPLRMIPRSAREIPGADLTRILAVNENELRSHPCSRLVVKRGQMWSALPALQDLLGLASY